MSYIDGSVKTPKGDIPRVSTRLSMGDSLGNLQVRFSINRMNYRVAPGLYAVGNPGNESHVFVSANYKLSFDALRRELTGMDAWILVLDTRGINVWCAAGKGTFGTDELVNRIGAVGLPDIVSHRKLIVPQFGAVGVSAHQIKERTGFNVIYGPIKAKDIKAFINAGMKATPAMRKMEFGIFDRMKLIGVELVAGVKIVVFAAALLYLVSQVRILGISFKEYHYIVVNIAFAYIAGAVIGTAFLPWLPGRAFALKGVFSGLLMFAVSYSMGYAGNSVLSIITWLCGILAVSSFVLMNFTGASTYTSLSGVKKEMRIAVPLQAVGAGIAVILIIVQFILGT